MDDNEMINGLLKFFRQDPIGHRVLEGKLDEVMMDLGHSRDFFKRAKLNYACPNFRAIETAIVMYRNEMKGGEYKE